MDNDNKEMMSNNEFGHEKLRQLMSEIVRTRLLLGLMSRQLVDMSEIEDLQKECRAALVLAASGVNAQDLDLRILGIEEKHNKLKERIYIKMEPMSDIKADPFKLLTEIRGEIANIQQRRVALDPLREKSSSALNRLLVIYSTRRDDSEWLEELREAYQELIACVSQELEAEAAWR